MSDLQEIYLVLFLIYLSECLVWVRPGETLIGLVLGKVFPRDFRGVFSNQSGGLRFTNPLPPFGHFFITIPPELCLSPDSVSVPSTASPASLPDSIRPGSGFKFGEIREIGVDGRILFVNKAPFLKASSSYAALRLARDLRSLADSPAEARADLMQKRIARRFDKEAISAIWVNYRSTTRILDTLAILLLLSLFVLAPLAVVHFGFHPALPGIAAGLLAQTVTISVIFRKLHRTFYPGAAEELFKRFLTMLLAAPAAVRAVEILGRRLLENYDPLAVMAVLAPGQKFERLAGEALRSAHFPPALPSQNPDFAACEQWHRAVYFENLDRFLTSHGCNISQLLAPPPRADPENRSYCPRCLTQFTLAQGVCRDCGGQKLLPLFAPLPGLPERGDDSNSPPARK